MAPAEQTLQIMDEAAQREHAAVVIAPSETAAILSMIERVAKDPNVDVGRLERLYDLRERAQAKAEEKAFNVAMAAVQSKLPRVVRDANNTQTNSRYARLETISRVITPIITEQGFSMSFGTDESPMQGHYRVTCRVGHVEGHSRDYHADIPSDGVGMKGTANKTATHAFGSSLSYARRYLTLLIFNIAMANEDDDGNLGPNATVRDFPVAADEDCIARDQVAILRKALEFVGRSEQKFCDAIKVDCLERIHPDSFDKALRIIQAAGARQ